MPLLFGILVVPTIFGIHYLVTRYKFGPRSRLALAGLGVLALVIPYFFLSYHFPLMVRLYLILGSIAFGAPLFTLFAVVMAELWRRAKASPLERNLVELKRSRKAAQEAVFSLDQRLEVARYRKSRVESSNPGGLERQRKLRQTLDDWQQGGGIARVRSIKVQEWTEQYRSMNVFELKSAEERLEAAQREAASAETGHADAELAVVRLELLSRELEEPNRELEAIEREITELTEKKRSTELEVPRLTREIEDLEAHRLSIVAERTALD